MAQGDTTIRTDFEVGGASAAKMTVQDVYKSQSEAMKKASNEEISASRKAMSAKRLAAQKSRELTKIAFAEERKAESLKAQQEASVVSLQRQRSAALIKIHNDEQKAIQKAKAETAREAKRLTQQQERDAKNLAKMEASQKGAIGKLMGRGLWGAAMGIAGYAGVAGVSSAISGLVEGVKNFTDKRAELEKTITPLISLGDNVNKMGEMRAQVVGIGAATGRSNEEIAAFLESLYSLSNTMAPSTLEEIKKQSLELSNLAGGDLQTNMRMLAKTNEIYGKSFQTVNQEQNKLFKIQQDADVPMAEMAYRMPELMASAKQLGFTFDEVGAGVISTTVALGRSEGAFTGLRNVYAAMEEAQKKGITLTGTFVQKLEQLKAAAASGQVSLLDIFGRDPLAAGGALLDRIDSVKENIQMLSQMGEKDTVKENLSRKFDDPRYRSAKLHDMDMALIENIPNISADLNINNKMTRLMDRFHAGKIAGGAVGGGMFGVPTIMGIAAMLGNDRVVDAGNRVRLKYTPEDSDLRKGLIKERVKYQFQSFEDKKQADISALGFDHRAQSSLGGMIGMDLDSNEVKAIKDRQFDLNAAFKDQPSLEKTMAVAAGIDESNSLLREIRDRLPATGSVTAKPGGSKVNSEETL